MSDFDPREILHPTFGHCRCDESKIAIFWKAGTSAGRQRELLRRLGLVPHPDPEPIGEGRQLMVVNRSSRLTWAVAKDGKSIDDKVLMSLERRRRVEWVAAGYSADTAESAGAPESVFCVNPTRLYLKGPGRDAAAARLEADAGAAIDGSRTAALPGLSAVTVPGANLPENRGALRAAHDLIAEAGDSGIAVRLENIPLIQPTCDVDCSASLPLVPNDPMFPSQWGMQRISAPHAWAVTQGASEVTVAVIDLGVELGHPDLDLHPESWNATTDTPDGSPTGNHGTPCAGIATGTLGNAQGPAGVAGGCRVMAIATATFADVDIAEALYFAADHGAKVVSMSFGVYPSWGVWDFDIIRDALQYAQDKGLVLVAASGNENGAASRFPGSDARTLCVGGSNRNDLRKHIGDASSENWWGASFGVDLDVVAPCLEIPATDRLGASGYTPGDYTPNFNGTSAATPHVAGLAALICTACPQLSNETIREVIEQSCDKISPATYAYGHVAHKTSGTWNEEVGYGRVNAERALREACRRCEKPDAECCPCELPHFEIEEDCVAPPAPPWKPFDACLLWYENRFVFDREQVCQLRLIYEHCLRLVGRQQGGLLYSVTLLPGETVRLFHYDRYRRVRSESQRLSVHTSLRQTTSALGQARTQRAETDYQDLLIQVRNDDDSDITIGGQLFPVSWNIEDPDPLLLTFQLGTRIDSVSSEFRQTVQTASQQVEAERSIVVSTFEEQEQRDVTSRSLFNGNDCRAVTYYVRRVNECYELTTRISEVLWRAKDRQTGRFGSWRAFDDLDGVDPEIRQQIEKKLKGQPRVGESLTDPRVVSVPTDGVLYEAELAHCSSCEPEKLASLQIERNRAQAEARKHCLEAELLALEVSRRRALLGQGKLESSGCGCSGSESETVSEAEVAE